MRRLKDGERIHVVDQKGRSYAFTLKAGETFHHSGETIAHDALIGQEDGTILTLSRGKRMVALLPMLSEYVVKMPRGAQVIYPKDLAMITIWADIYPGARVLEAGTGSGSLTMALLRAVGNHGSVVTYDTREDFSRTARKNIEQYMGPVPQLTMKLGNIYEGIPLDSETPQFDRLVLDLAEPWRVIPHARQVLRSGGVYLSFVPTIPQVMQTVDALEGACAFAQIQTFETLLRTWNIQGRSVRPDHRMVAHSGFITVARKVEAGFSSGPHRPLSKNEEQPEEAREQDSEEGEDLSNRELHEEGVG